MILLVTGMFLLVAPRLLSSLEPRLHPREQVKLSIGAMLLGVSFVELALVLLALPVVLRAFGYESLTVTCCRWFGDLAPDGLSVGWPAAVLSALGPLLAWRGWANSSAEVAEMRVEPALGVHRDIDGIDVVVLATEIPIAYGIDDGRAQIVLSEGLVALVSPAELEAVVYHEMAHIRNRDGRILRILAAVEAGIPAMRRVGQPVRIAIERAADEWATVCDRAPRSTLLSALLRVAAPDGLAMSVTRFTGDSGIVERASALLDPPRNPTYRQRVTARLLVVGVAGCGIVAAAGLAIAAHVLLSIAGLCCT